MVGITNTTVISLDNITYIANSSTPAHFFVNVNEIVFNGYAFFLILLTLWIILAVVMYKRKPDEVAESIMYSGAVITIGSFFARAVEVYVYGVKKGLLIDKLLYIFPLITMFIAWILWLTKD